MLNWRDKEACGIPLLGTFAMDLAEQLSQKQEVEFRTDMEFPVVTDKLKQGKKPACDSAVWAILMKRELPVVLYEYKPV